MTTTWFEKNTALKLGLPLWLNKRKLFGRVVVELSLEEIEEARIRAQREREEETILKENIKHAKFCVSMLPKACQKAGIAREYSAAKRKGNIFVSRYELVKLGEIIISPDAYFIRIASMPDGKLVETDLNKPEVMSELASKVGSTVGLEFFGHHRWFRVEAKYGRGRIPEEVGYYEAFKEITEKDGHLVWVVGKGANQKVIKLNLQETPHVMLSGASGGGKTVHLHNIICTFLQRNRPDQLRLSLTDLKGNDLVDYRGIPHLGPLNIMVILGPKEEKPAKPKRGERPPILWQGRKMLRTEPIDYILKEGEEGTTEIGQEIITKPEDVLPVVYMFVLEMNRRNELFGSKKPPIKDLAQWNNRYPTQQMPYMLIVIDELFRLTLGDKTMSAQFTWAVSEIVGTGRASGMRTIICTQSPTEAVVPQLLRHNFAAFIATRASNNPASGIALGDGSADAAKLPAFKANGGELKGRMLIRNGATKDEVQGPYIQSTTIADTVKKAIAGNFVDVKGAELAQKANLLFDVALSKFGGRCVKNELYSIVQKDMTLSEIDKIIAHWLFKYDNHISSVINVTGDAQMYYLLPGVKHRLCTPTIPPVLVAAIDFEQKKHPYKGYYDYFDTDFTRQLTVEEYALKSQELRAEANLEKSAEQVAAEEEKKEAEWQKALVMFNYSLANLNGKCAVSELYQYLKPTGYSKKYIQICLDNYVVKGEYPDNLYPVIKISDRDYILAPNDIKSQISRWLVLRDDYISKRHPNSQFNAYNEVVILSPITIENDTIDENLAEPVSFDQESEGAVIELINDDTIDFGND